MHIRFFLSGLCLDYIHIIYVDGSQHFLSQSKCRFSCRKSGQFILYGLPQTIFDTSEVNTKRYRGQVIFRKVCSLIQNR